MKIKGSNFYNYLAKLKIQPSILMILIMGDLFLESFLWRDILKGNPVKKLGIVFYVKLRYNTV